MKCAIQIYVLLTYLLTWKQTGCPQRQKKSFRSDSNHTFNTEKGRKETHTLSFLFAVYANIAKMLKNDH